MNREEMECFSGLFRQTLMIILDATNTVVGSISLKEDVFIGAIKKRPDTLLKKVSEKNRKKIGVEIGVGPR